jgi:hypothetical protein
MKYGVFQLVLQRNKVIRGQVKIENELNYLINDYTEWYNELSSQTDHGAGKRDREILLLPNWQH